MVRFSLPLLLSLLASPALAGVTIEVPDDRPNLSSALSAAHPGDTIRLAAGTHVLPAGRVLDVPVSGAGAATVLMVNGTTQVMVDVAAGESIELSGLTLNAQGTRAVVCNGGSLTFTDVVLEAGGPGEHGLGGGLARFVDCEVLLDRVRFNTTSIAAPGGLLQAIDSDLTIVDSTFVGGEATEGGALHVTGGSLSLLDTIVSGSNALPDNGGGLYADGVVVRSVRTTWVANSAGGAGGAIWAVDGSYRSVEEAFTSNTATGGAGGLRLARADTVVTGASFTGNVSGAAGGLTYRGPGSVLVEDSRFVNNTGANGGGLAIDQTDGGRVERNRFCGNVAQGTDLQGNGGGLYSVPSLGGDLTGANNLFVANQADDGGGVYGTGGTFVHDTYVRNTANRGAAVTVVLGLVELRDSVFAGNLQGEVIQSVFAAPPNTTFSLFFDNDQDPAFTLDASNLVATAPQLVDRSSTLCDAASFMPVAGSPLIDAASDLDGDGTPADIGAFGGPDLTDADADGIVASADCDDTDAMVGRPTMWFTDGDGDGFGRQAAEVGCGGMALADVAGDCDDTDVNRFPGADDLPNGLDDDCDLVIDEVDGTAWFLDDDTDGYGDPTQTLFQLTQPVGYVDNADDCDDTDAMVNPLGMERCGTGGVDEDCDELVDDQDPDVQGQTSWPLDDDGDGYGAPTAVVLGCVQPAGTSLNTDDCDDDDPTVNPDGVEVCDPEGLVDEDCNGLVDDLDPNVAERLSFFADADGDGFAGTPAMACVRPSSAEDALTDCNDADPTISPDGTEICDPADVDEDCSGLADDLDPGVTGQSLRHDDLDGDGFGDATTAALTCDETRVLDATDCDDTDPSLGPPLLRTPDLDGDGYGDADATATLSCVGVTDATDCNDADPTVNPGAIETWYDDVDQDCDGGDDNDQDRDGVPLATDCNDTDPNVFPGAEDLPDDAVDQDCDGSDAVYVYSNGTGCSTSGTPMGLSGLLSRRR